MRKEKVFLGSSSEAGQATFALRDAIIRAGGDFEFVYWRQTAWRNLETALSSIEASINDYDYAIFLAYPDDKVTIRGHNFDIVRDNVIFEFGLFLSRLGNSRTFLVRPDNPEMQLLSDIGPSPTMPIYTYRRLPSGDLEHPINFDRAASAILSTINGKIHEERSSLSKINAKSKLDAEVQQLSSDLKIGETNKISLFNTSSMVKAKMYELIKYKTYSSERTPYDVAYDLSRSFSMVEDMIDIYQLSREQKHILPGRDEKLLEVVIFAEKPIELHGHRKREVQIQVEALKNTIRDNIRAGVKYTYYGSPNFAEDKLIQFLEAKRISRKASKACVELVKVPHALFKTFFTIHRFPNRDEVFMSLLAEDRDDLLIKLNHDHAERVCGILKTLRGQVRRDGKYMVRDFVGSGPS